MKFSVSPELLMPLFWIEYWAKKETQKDTLASWGNLIFTPENLGVGPVDATHKQSPTKLLLHVALPTCFVYSRYFHA